MKGFRKHQTLIFAEPVGAHSPAAIVLQSIGGSKKSLPVGRIYTAKPTPHGCWPWTLACPPRVHLEVSLWLVIDAVPRLRCGLPRN